MPRLLLLVLLLAALPARPAAAQPDTTAAAAGRQRPLRAADPLDEIVWLARCILSESDLPHEQRLVAWVVRNRVETHYRGTSYREVVLEPFQFSAFNEPTERRAYLLSLEPQTPGKAWQRALDIARDVYYAPAAQRPFASTTRHFYSPVSMPGGAAPHWAAQAQPLNSLALGVDPNRFLFFDAVDEAGAMIGAESPEEAGGSLQPTLGGTRQLRSRVARPTRPTVARPQVRSRAGESAGGS